MANYKNWFKPLVEVKDLMLTWSGGLAVEKEEYKPSKWLDNATDYNVDTFVELGGHKIHLYEHYEHFREKRVYAYYYLEMEQPDGKKSRLILRHNFGYSYDYEYDSKLDSFELLEHSGIFDMLKPSELKKFYMTWYYLCYDRREVDNYRENSKLQKAS